jgi:hypothetical protein
MTTCPQCRAPLDMDAVFCDQCGTSRSIQAAIASASMGASGDCDFVLNQPAISSSHARLDKLADGTYLVVDAGSTNGVFVNGARVRTEAITRHDLVTMGSVPIDLVAVLDYLDQRASSAPGQSPKQAPSPQMPAVVHRPAHSPVQQENRLPDVQRVIVQAQRPAPSRFACPHCDNENVQRVSLFDQTTKRSGGGCGCNSCLLLIIIFILAPVLVLVFGLVAGVAIAMYWPYIAGIIGLGLLINIITAIVNRNVYVCLRCNNRFRPD